MAAGNITKRGKNTWRVRVFLGRDANGKQKTHSHTVHGTKNDAQTYLNRVLRERDLGTWSVPSEESMETYLRRWMDDLVLPDFAPSTVELYQIYLTRHLVPGIGHIRLAKLTPLDIQGLYTRLRSTMAASSVRRIHGMLSSALRQAVDWKLIPFNPASQVKVPKDRKREMRALALDEAPQFLAAASQGQPAVLLAFLVATGLRPGEAMALRWKDMNLKTGVLSVRRSVTWKKGGTYEFTDTKTEKSTRTLPLPSSLIPRLKEHKGWVAETRLKAGASWHDNDLVFPAQDGRPLRRGMLGKWVKRCLKAAGLPSDLRSYDLRHSCATLLLANGTHPKVVADRLGHASVALTLDTYSHVAPNIQAEASHALERMLFGQ